MRAHSKQVLNTLGMSPPLPIRHQPICIIYHLSLVSLSRYHPLSLISSKLYHLGEVSENEILTIIKNSPAKSSLLDQVPTFRLKDCVDILLIISYEAVPFL